MPLHKSAEGWVRHHARKEAGLPVRSARMDHRIHALNNQEIVDAVRRRPEAVVVPDMSDMPDFHPVRKHRRNARLFG